MFGIDWNDLQLYHYLAIGGGGLAVLALLLYFVLPKGGKVPAGLLGTIAGLVAGIGVGVIGMAAYGYQLPKESGEVGEVNPNLPDIPPAGKGFPGKGGQGKGNQGPGGAFGFGKGGGKGKGPNSKTQLAQLVAKMDQLTGKPPTLSLSDEQRKLVHDQLKDLSAKDELSEDEAKQRLDTILDAVKDHRESLVAVGFFWPNKVGGIPTPPANLPNPFKAGPAHEQLQALQKRLTK